MEVAVEDCVRAVGRAAWPPDSNATPTASEAKPVPLKTTEHTAFPCNIIPSGCVALGFRARPAFIPSFAPVKVTLGNLQIAGNPGTKSFLDRTAFFVTDLPWCHPLDPHKKKPCPDRKSTR